jgi:carbonic anhydrase
MISAREALARLQEGNRQFVAGNYVAHNELSPDRRNELVSGQSPFAVILGCSDSRVPVEVIFNQGFGDLFVIRVAGNVVAPSQIGSIEFAVEQFGTPLVVVLGHSCCGAVKATLEELQRPSASQSRNLRSIVDRVRPAVADLLTTDLAKQPEKLMATAVRSNVCVAAGALRHGSEILEGLVQNGKLMVVGAEYSLATGEVCFFDGLPDQQ